MANGSLDVAMATSDSMQADGDMTHKDVEDKLLLQSRLYQVEMFEESLKRNIIVVVRSNILFSHRIKS
jgi:hypothetical protein